MSSQDFEGVAPDRTAEFIDELAEHGTGSVVCHLRHPAEWVESSFKWHVMREPGRFTSIGQYIEGSRHRLALARPRRQSRSVVEGSREFGASTLLAGRRKRLLSLIGAADIAVSREDTSIRNLAKLVCDVARPRPV